MASTNHPIFARFYPRMSQAMDQGRHGSWYVQLELPGGLDGHRRRIRRGGYPSRKAAVAVLARLRSPHPGHAGTGVLTVGDWLAHWLVARTATAPSTVRGYAIPVGHPGHRSAFFEDFQDRPVPLFHHTQLPQHTRPPFHHDHH